jgi:tellurite resistance protein TehA-like permease
MSNPAQVTATQAIGKTLDSNAIQIVGTVMAVILIVVWFLVFCLMIRALMTKRLLWPEEDRRDDAVSGLKDARR